MKRAALLVAILVAAVVAGIALLPTLMSSDRVWSKVLSQLQAATGRNVSFSGIPSLSFRPFLGIELTGLTVTDGTDAPGIAPLLQVEKVQARLKILPALAGQIEIDEYLLVRPTLNLRVLPDGNSNWRFNQGTLAEALEKTAKARDEGTQGDTTVPGGLGNFTIQDGTATYEDAISGLMVTVSNIDGRLDWPSFDTQASYSGSGVWNGESLTVNGQIEAPLELLSEGESQLAISAVSPAAEVSFNGNANMLSDLFLAGDMRFSTPSLERFSRFSGIGTGGLSIKEGLEANGRINATADDVKLEEAAIRIGDFPATGVLQLTVDEVGDKRIAGTLAFEDIDLGNFLGGISAIDTANDTAPDAGISMDVRFSAQSVQWGEFTLEMMAAALSTTGGEWTLDVGDVQLYGGTAIAKIGSRLRENVPQRFADVSLRGVDLSQMPSISSASRLAIGGPGDLDAKFTANGGNAADIRRDMNGTLRLSYADGTLSGIDLDTLFNSTGENPQRYQLLDGSGETPFDAMQLELDVQNGIGIIRQGSMKAPESTVNISGNVDLAAGTLAVRVLRQPEGELATEQLTLGGSFANPLVALEQRPTDELRDAGNEAAEEVESDVSN